MLAPMTDLRSFTGLERAEAVARALREQLGLPYIQVNAKGLVTVPNELWQLVRTGQYIAPTSALVNPIPAAQNVYDIKPPSAPHATAKKRT